MGGFLIFGLILGSAFIRPNAYRGQHGFSMGHVVLIFGLPMLIAAWLISSTVLEIHHLLREFWLIVILSVIFPFAGWPALIALATAYAANPEFTGQSRAAFLFEAWLDGAVLAASIIIWFLAMSETQPGLNPTLGYVVGGFDLSMLVSFGFWGAMSFILPRPEMAIKAALVTGVALFCIGCGLLHLDDIKDNYLMSDKPSYTFDNAVDCLGRGGTIGNYNGGYTCMVIWSKEREAYRKHPWGNNSVSVVTPKNDPSRAQRVTDFARATHLNFDDARLCESRGGQYMVEGGNDHFTCVARREIPLR